MVTYSEDEFFSRMQAEGFSEGAISAARGILDWALKNKQVSHSWSGEKVLTFNVLADGKRFISISASKGWDIEIPFRDHAKNPLFEDFSKSQEVIERLRRMGIESGNPALLSTEHRRAIKLQTVQPKLKQFLELLDWVVDEIRKEQKL